MENFIFILFMTVSVMSVVELTSAHPCQSERISCTVHSYCPAGQACVGPEGNKKCRNCECHQPSQCYLAGNKVECNCTGTGYTGSHCECEKKKHSDILFWHSYCLTYSDEFLTVENGYWTGDTSNATKFHTFDKQYCFNECTKIPNCYVVFYEGHSRICNKFVYPEPPMLGDVVDKVVRSPWNSHSIVRIRNCIERVIDYDV